MDLHHTIGWMAGREPELVLARPLSHTDTQVSTHTHTHQVPGAHLQLAWNRSAVISRHVLALVPGTRIFLTTLLYYHYSNNPYSGTLA